MKTMTVEEAQLQGYEYATLQYGEGKLIDLADIVDDKSSYLLVEKEGKPFKIGEDVLKDLVDDYINNQDEVDNEDGELNDLVAGVDYSEITKKLNDALANRIYFFATDIKLIIK